MKRRTTIYRRVTIDTDNHYLLGTAWKVFKLLQLNPFYFEYRRTTRGYHLIAWFERNIKQYQIREKLGDDKNRIKIDKKKKRIRQVLFSKKSIKYYN